MGAELNSTLVAAIDARRLVLRAGDAFRLELALDEGGRHRLVVEDIASARRAVASLESCPGVGVLTATGSLPGAMTVAESLALALRYGQEETEPGDDEHEMEAALQLCGLTPQRIATLGSEQPMKLARTERWTIGLARWLLRPPELLVIDRLFAGLTRREAEELTATEAIYHRRHPFRTALFVDLDSHELPELPECRSVTHLAEAPCPC
jgi:ABC-type glutathione transport system ATPase component